MWFVVGVLVGSVATWMVSKTPWGNKFFTKVEKEVGEELVKVKSKINK